MGTKMSRCLFQAFALLCALAASSAPASSLYFVHTDHLGTPQKITDSGQQVVWEGNPMPFGETEVVVNQIDFHVRFPGQYFDGEAGLHYNYFRDYDPGLGRYVQSDPIGLRGGSNTYAYVGGNPLKGIDPLGLQTTVIVTYDFGIGSHASVHVDTGQGSPILYDPNGSYIPPGGIPPGSGDMHDGANANLDDYVKHHEGEGSTVKQYPLNLTSEQEQQLTDNILNQPTTPPLGCAISTSSVLSGMCGIEPTWWPGNLADQAKNAKCP